MLSVRRTLTAFPSLLLLSYTMSAESLLFCHVIGLFDKINFETFGYSNFFRSFSLSLRGKPCHNNVIFRSWSRFLGILLNFDLVPWRPCSSTEPPTTHLTGHWNQRYCRSRWMSADARGDSQNWLVPLSGACQVLVRGPHRRTLSRADPTASIHGIRVYFGNVIRYLLESSSHEWWRNSREAYKYKSVKQSINFKL